MNTFTSHCMDVCMYIYIYMYIFQFNSITSNSIWFPRATTRSYELLSSPFLFFFHTLSRFSSLLSCFIYFSLAMNIDILRPCCALIFYYVSCTSFVTLSPIRLYADAPTFIFYHTLFLFYPAAYVCSVLRVFWISLVSTYADVFTSLCYVMSNRHITSRVVSYRASHYSILAS